MTEYSDLNDNVRNYTETDTNVLSDAIVQPFIESIEYQILRTVDLTYFRKYDYATLAIAGPCGPPKKTLAETTCGFACAKDWASVG